MMSTDLLTQVDVVIDAFETIPEADLVVQTRDWLDQMTLELEAGITVRMNLQSVTTADLKLLRQLFGSVTHPNAKVNGDRIDRTYLKVTVDGGTHYEFQLMVLAGRRIDDDDIGRVSKQLAACIAAEGTGCDAVDVAENGAVYAGRYDEKSLAREHRALE